MWITPKTNNQKYLGTIYIPEKNWHFDKLSFYGFSAHIIFMWV